jgi:uncharacterized cupredoxin-like copper-binding protein
MQMQRNRAMVTAFSVVALIVAVAARPALAAPGAPGHAHDEFSAGAPGNPKKPSRPILVTMKETDDGKMIYMPDKIEVKRGEQIRFIITNAGQVPHEFVLASTKDNEKHAVLMQKYPDMEHDDPNGKTLQPKQRVELLWKFSKGGTFEFACLIPGHREAGMLGNVNVK